MAIVTNPRFDVANQQLAKRPLYMAFIDSTFDALSTFRAEDLNVALTGYGIGGYGINGYGS